MDSNPARTELSTKAALIAALILPGGFLILGVIVYRYFSEAENRKAFVMAMNGIRAKIYWLTGLLGAAVLFMADRVAHAFGVCLGF